MSSKIKLLLIEDNPADIRLIQEMLLEMNDTDIDGNTFDTSTAETLSSGMEQSIKSEFDVIILDLSLPDSHGIDTFNKIHIQLPQKPIIILSGLDDTKLAIEAVHNGAQDYLVKGHVDSHLLVRAIRYAIARNKTEIEKNHIQTQLFQAQKMEAIGILAGGVAHDFNNLMTAIQGFSDVMIMKTDETNPSYRALKQIRNAASSAADLTRQMLFFSRKQHMEYVTLNINKVIENMLKILHRLTGEDIGISVVTDSNISMIKADRGTLEQVIMNLVFNAKDAMPEGGRITIKTRTEKINENQCAKFPGIKPGQYVHLSVADTGIGMDEKTLQRIFEPFYSTKGPNKGTGLGLSVVYGIVKEHQGWIYTESNPDKGTIFHLYFPVLQAEDELEIKETFSAEDYQGDGKKILLVEDSQGVREFAVIALSENGYIIHAASTASEANEIFKNEKGKFDLIISDVVLPDQSGVKLANQFQAEKPNIPIVLCSGYSDDKLNWSIIKDKGYKFLQKPYAFSDLLQVAKEITSHNN